jgi:hypothetical protein
MNPLLENPLVKKYFGGHPGKHIDGMCDDLISMRVLDAMCQPIKKGDRILFSDNSDQGNIKEEIAVLDYSPWWQICGVRLRLPDEFQKTECPNLFLTCSCGMKCEHKPAPEPEKCNHSNCIHDGVIRSSSAVEKKKDETINYIEKYVHMGLATTLRELIALARAHD